MVCLAVKVAYLCSWECCLPWRVLNMHYQLMVFSPDAEFYVDSTGNPKPLSQASQSPSDCRRSVILHCLYSSKNGFVCAYLSQKHSPNHFAVWITVITWICIFVVKIYCERLYAVQVCVKRVESSLSAISNRVALKVLDFPDLTLPTSDLTGLHAMAIRHLRCQGYTVVQVK